MCIPPFDGYISLHKQNQNASLNYIIKKLAGIVKTRQSGVLKEECS
jgi:hypothetical protein